MAEEDGRDQKFLGGISSALGASPAHSAAAPHWTDAARSPPTFVVTTTLSLLSRRHDTLEDDICECRCIAALAS